MKAMNKLEKKKNKGSNTSIIRSILQEIGSRPSALDICKTELEVVAEKLFLRAQGTGQVANVATDILFNRMEGLPGNELDAAEAWALIKRKYEESPEEVAQIMGLPLSELEARQQAYLQAQGVEEQEPVLIEMEDEGQDDPVN